jgi:HSP20 family protein
MSNKHPVNYRSEEQKSYLQNHPFHRMIRNFWGGDFDVFGERLTTPRYHTDVSLSEDKEHVFVEAALPGLKESEIEVTFEKGILWIRGEKKEEEDNKKYHYRASRSYSYHIALPETIDTKKEINAKYEKGILHVTFDKAEGEVAKKITIKCCDR